MMAALVLAALGCPPAQQSTTTATTTTQTASTSSASISSSTSTSSTTTVSQTTGSTTLLTTAASTTGGGACEASFVVGCGGCAADELCVHQTDSDVGSNACRPNPDGCVPEDPCSPVCLDLCGSSYVCGGDGCTLLCLDPITCWVGFGHCNEDKCVPADKLDDGASWDGTQCVPTVPDPDPIGDPCESEAGGVPIDSCIDNAICTGGVCLQTCGRADPPCPEEALCVGYLGGVVPICRPLCDPLMSDCPEGEVCVVKDSEGFICAGDASGESGVDGDACEHINGCDPGLACVTGSALVGCDDTRCCTPLCDTTLPDPCTGGESCVPWYQEGMAPPSYEDVGVCALMP